MAPWRLPRGRRRRATQPERSGGWGAPGGPTRPPKPKPRVVHGDGSWVCVLWICKADIEVACTVLSTFPDYSILYRKKPAAGRRSTRDTISALHARGCMSPTRTQALSSAEKSSSYAPWSRTWHAATLLSRPSSHGCHVSLTAWGPEKVPELAGVCAVGLFVQRRLERRRRVGRVPQ